MIALVGIALFIGVLIGYFIGHSRGEKKVPSYLEEILISVQKEVSEVTCPH